MLTEATDAVDEGMALARHWESRDAGRFRTQAKELFKFGCRLYPIYQPHFLTEFLLENMEQKSFGEDMNLHMSAIEALRRTLADIQHGGFTALNTPRFDQTLDHLRELRITEERLTELRRLQSTNPVKGSP